MATEIKSARDALVEIVNKLEPIVTYMKPSEEDGLSTVYAACKPIYDIAQAALAAPPRNCEVGTPEEQDARFESFCDAHKCFSCPAKTLRPFLSTCALKWAQMPYEEKEGVVK